MYILLADGTEELEFVACYDILVRAGFTVHSIGVSLATEHATCTRHIRIIPDIPTLSALPPVTELARSPSVAALIIPGGGPGAATMASSLDVSALINAFRAAGKLVGAICAGTTALVAAQEREEAKAGKVRVTSHPSVRQGIVDKGWEYADERVVVDGNVVTSRGPGSAIAFALKVVEVLAGKDKAEEVRGPLMCADTL
ncbi:hypothetical protein ANO11243_077740 [Dothideomycetidae sp. 11243]|nr:hypothetical protein ANO11243_077740 [fungal sp. No.11243]